MLLCSSPRRDEEQSLTEFVLWGAILDGESLQAQESLERDITKSQINSSLALKLVVAEDKLGSRGLNSAVAAGTRKCYLALGSDT